MKLAQSRDSESEKEEEEEDIQMQQIAAEEDPDNPWVVKRSKEMEDFVSGYRKYWESEGKDLKTNKISDTAGKVTSSTIDLSKSPQNGNHVEENKREHPPKTKPAQSLAKIEIGNDSTLNYKEKSKSIRPEKKSPPTTSTPVSLTPKTASSEFQVSDSVPPKRNQNQSPKKKSIRLDSNLEERNGSHNNHFQIWECKTNIGHSNNKSTKTLPPSSWVVSDIKDTKSRLELNKSNASKNNNLRLHSLSNSFEVTKSKVVKKIKLKSKDLNKVGDLSPSVLKEDARKEKSLDKLFEEVEDKIQNRIQEKVNKLKESLSKKRKNDDQVNVDLEAEDTSPSLELKKQKISPDLDEELIENTGKGGNEIRERDLLSKSLNVPSNETKESNDIDPNKFLKVTPRILSAQLPEMMTEGDDAVDDEETTTEDRHLTISEAFADDDVVDQFQ